MSRAVFHPRQSFEPQGGYRLLPFRFESFDSSRRIVANDAGAYHLLTNDEFERFVSHRLQPGEEVYLDLKGKHFLFDSASLVPFELTAAAYRTRKSFLRDFTQLHIFVVTLRCEHSCHYCQVSRVSSDRARYDMSNDTAERALDLAFRSPAQSLKIELQGGEPLLHFDAVRTIILSARRRAAAAGKRVEFVVTSNLALLDDVMLALFAEHDVALSTSLDGPASLHDANRPRPERNSHALAVAGIERARAVLGQDRVAALMTASRASLSNPREVIDEYVRLGFHSIFLRSLSPYGFAVKSGARIGYSSAEFVAFYEEALDYLIELNATGIPIAETYAQILLTRILTPFATGYVDLQSPAGAGFGAVVYNYDGDVYVSDEARMLAEMNDHQFRLGNVHRDDYATIFGGEVLRKLAAGSIVESLPGCADCAYQSYCGADPVFRYATQGDVIGHRAFDDFHKKNYALIRLLIRRYESSELARTVFRSWIAA